jgi:hypothetical protein
MMAFGVQGWHVFLPITAIGCAGHHEHPELKSWYENLRRGNGPCCDDGDAKRVRTLIGVAIVACRARIVQSPSGRDDFRNRPNVVLDQDARQRRGALIGWNFAVSYRSLMLGFWLSWKNSLEISRPTECTLISGPRFERWWAHQAKTISCEADQSFSV